MNEESIFAELLTKPTPAEKDAYLQEQCGADVRLRSFLEKLLAGHNRKEGILDESITIKTSPTSRQIGSYRLKELLGEGGFGQVFAAEQHEPVRRDVAIKLIKPGMDSREVIARFSAERQALALMDHPNIARVLEAGTTENDRPYFVMELVRGKNITEYCDLQRFTTHQRLNLFLPICQAVQHAHQKGIIHRDLKPSNILVTEQDGQPTVKVIDFGVAKALDPHQSYAAPQTRETQLIGTPAYMSPEQAEMGGRDIDTRTDIYSLGVLLYELLAGATPFDGERWKSASFDEIRRIIREEEPPKPSARLSTLGDSITTISANRRSHPRELSRLFRGELDWIVMKAIEKQRDRRYSTVTELAKDIHRYLSDEPVEASPPSTLYRLRKFARKHRYAVLSGSAMFILLAGGIVGTTLGMFEAQKAQGAEKLRAQAEERERIRAEKAEIQAKAKEKQALEAAEIANKLIAFLRDDVLSINGIGTQSGQGLSPRPNITLREALDRAASKLNTQFQAEPLVEAQIRYALGHSYLQLGQFQQALEQLELAVEISKQRAGPNGRTTQMAEVALARTYRCLGRVSEAIELHEKIRDAQMVEWGAEDLRTLVNLHHLAESYTKDGRHSQALTLQKPVYEAFLRKQGPDHENTLAALHNIGAIHAAAGNNDEALEIFEGLNVTMPKVLGEDHVRTMDLRQQLGVIYWKQKQTHKAIAVFESLLPAIRKIYGASHPETYRVMTNLGVNYRDHGQTNEAIKVLTAAYGASRTYSFLRSWAGPELIRAHLAAGEREKAVQLMANLVESTRRANAPRSTQLATELMEYIAVLQLLQDWRQAELIARECLAIWEKPPTDAANALIARALLGETLLEHAISLQDQSQAASLFQEAETLLAASAKGLLTLGKPTPATDATIIKTLDSLIKHSELNHKPDQADHWRREKSLRSKSTP
jgi:serine/threonine protein kinase/tetratricopeptide (TPR) repeat protein